MRSELHDYCTDQSLIKLRKGLGQASIFFHQAIIQVILSESRRLKKHKDSIKALFAGSRRMLEVIEQFGGRFEFTGTENYKNLEGPAIFVGNHVSMMETMVIFYLMKEPLSFVFKKSLQKIPAFSSLLMTGRPISVSRKSPGKDLQEVLEQGTERLREGQSVIIFPQGGRRPFFDPLHFNSIGIKLALKSGYPVIPIALKTDFWGNGGFLSFFGKIAPEKTIHIKLGAPVFPKGRGKAEHQEILNFLETNLKAWDFPVLEKKDLS